MSRPSYNNITSKDYQTLAESFLNYLLQLGYVAASCRAQYNYLKAFLCWRELGGRLKIETTNSAEITEYYRHLSQRPSLNHGGQLSLKTRYAQLHVIKKVFIYLEEQNLVDHNPCSLLNFDYPKPKTSRTVLTQTEIKALYEACENGREKAILSLGYGCGLRVSELVGLDKKDLQFRDKILIVRKGKGNKKRVVPLSNKVRKDIVEYYYNDRENLTKAKKYVVGEKAFMLNSNGQRMQKYTLNKYLKRIIQRAVDQNKISQEILHKNITMHNLRHSIATHLIEQGISTEQVRLFLGHQHLESTQIYTHINQKLINKLKT